MVDNEKTKAQLKQELKLAYDKIAKLESELEKHMKIANNNIVNRSPRIEIKADIEFIGDFDIIHATGINLSETGICFELAQDLPFEMKFTLDGKSHHRRANLVWVRKMPEGGYRFGLKFVPRSNELDF